jgi:protein-disulfide isomerase
MKRLGLLALLSLASPALAFDPAAMTDAERDAFGAEVRAYLLEHPEVLQEVATALEIRQQSEQLAADAAMIADNQGLIFDDAASFVGGNPEGSLTVVEFIDYRCSYCRKAHAEVEELIRSDGEIRYVVKEFPILGEQSVLAARFAIATLQLAGPEAYEKVKNGFYDGTFRGDVSAETLAGYATSLGIDSAAVMARMSDPAVMKVIEDNHALASVLQISGTPTFVMGDSMIRGYVPLDQMRAIVAEERNG